MNRDKQNQEGYDDPTAYEAITNIEQEERALRAFRPIVYICSPYSGDVEHNVKAAQGYSRHAFRSVFRKTTPRNGCWACSLATR